MGPMSMLNVMRSVLHSLHGCFNISASLMKCLKAHYTVLYRAWSMHTTVTILGLCLACLLGNVATILN